MKYKYALIFLVFFSFVFASSSVALAEMVSIKGDDINMRSGPGTKYKVIWKLGSGFPLKVLRKKGSWYRVQDFEGTIGWVHRNVTSRKQHMIVKVNKKTKKRINVRSGPGTNNRIVAKAYYGVVFKTIKQKSGWVQIEHDKGVNGWVKRSLLWGF